MAWVVDTCVLIDLRLGDAHAQSSARCLAQHSKDGLLISPITYVELAPAFGGDAASQDGFLSEYAIQSIAAWTSRDTALAHQLWHQSVQRRRAQQAGKRPIADILIAAFALRWQGLITRNVSDFRTITPALPLVDAATFTV